MEVAMNRLSRESQALLAATRHRDGLSAADKDRVRDKLNRRLGAGLALGSAVTASATVAEAAHTTLVATVAAWLPGAAKVLGVVAIASGVTVGAVRVSQHGAQESAITATAAPLKSISKPSIARELPQAAPISQGDRLDRASEPVTSPASIRRLPAIKRDSYVSTASSVTNEPASQPAAKSTDDELSNQIAAIREPAAPSVDDGLSSQIAAIREPAAPSVDDGLSSQIAAIREARAAIRRGDGRAALAALDKGLPPGQGGPLEQEAVFARVSALCLLGDVSSAKRTADQFLARFPDSLLVPRLRNSCAYGASNAR
jgi:hypothetical protein